MAFDTTHDIVPDSPTNTFAILNSLDAESATLSNGNLAATINSGPNNSTTVIPLSGTWYWEVYISDHTNIYMGIQKIETQESGYSQDAVAVNNTGNVYYDASYQNIDALPSIATGDIISVFWDIDNKKIWFAQNGQFYDATGTAHPTLTLSQVASGVNGYDYSSNIPNSAKPFFGSSAISAGIICNFGQDHLFGGVTPLPSGAGSNTPDNGIGTFAFSVPSGAKALCTANIQSDLAIDPAVDDPPEDYMKAVIYTGNESTGVSKDIGFQPDLIWAKARSTAYNHIIIDSLRPHSDLNSYYRLHPDLTNAEADYNDNIYITNNGFNCYARQSGVNENSQTFVAWCWKAGGAPSGDGVAMVDDSATTCSALATSAGASITPARMSVNTKSGFSIIKYTGTGSTASVPHGLLSTPELIICKTLSQTIQWVVYHKDTGPDGFLGLNTTTGFSSDTDYWGTGTGVTNAVFGLQNAAGGNNHTSDLIAYCWHSVAGYSAFSSYIGNGSTDGPFVYTGFKPAFLIVKAVKNAAGTSITRDWLQYDTARGGASNPFTEGAIQPNSSGVPYGGDYITAIDFLSNGFKIRKAHGNINGDTETHIYMAFAEMPFKYSATNAR